MLTVAKHYTAMNADQRMRHKEYLEKCLQVPDGKIGQCKWMWPLWKESLAILQDVMVELGELEPASPNPKYDCDDCAYYPCYHQEMVDTTGDDAKLKYNLCGDHSSRGVH
jgi:hypothetical protein